MKKVSDIILMIKTYIYFFEFVGISVHYENLTEFICELVFPKNTKSEFLVPTISTALFALLLILFFSLAFVCIELEISIVFWVACVPITLLGFLIPSASKRKIRDIKEKNRRF